MPRSSLGHFPKFAFGGPYKIIAGTMTWKTLELVQSDLLKIFRDGALKLIISDPPYVTTDAMERHDDEYRHEPALALGCRRRRHGRHSAAFS